MSGGQDQGRGHGWGVKVRGGVKVWGVKVVVNVGGQGHGVKVKGMIGGHKVGISVGGQSRGVNVRGSMSGGGVMVRGMSVKVWGVGVRWSVGLIVVEVVDKYRMFL